MSQAFFNITDVLALVACVTGGSALYLQLNKNELPHEQPKLLIYDRVKVAGQIAPYVAGAVDPMTVVDQAIEEATRRGYFIIDSELNLKGPENAIFRLDQFVPYPEPLSSREGENG